MIDTVEQWNIEELIGRQEYVMDPTIARPLVEGQTILVTGAGGSIGSEICRQLVKLGPKQLLLLGHGEYSIYRIYQALLQLKGNVECVPLVVDIRNKEHVSMICKQYLPTVIYHAAAHKHVPLMESQPLEAVNNNIYGTLNMLEVALAIDCSSFIMISTDKAVYPTSVMGATKRVAEMLVSSIREQTGKSYSSVRFGNVLNSRGSVLPFFVEQIKQGGPITITDYQMTRYFMTVKEAAYLVLRAGTLASKADLFVMDMGEPVKIIDLAQAIIQHYGRSDSIEIVETGKRKGERIEEIYLTEKELISEQVDEHLFIGKNNHQSLTMIKKWLNHLCQLPPDHISEELIRYTNTLN